MYKTDNGSDVGLFIVAGEDDKIRPANVFYIRFETRTGRQMGKKANNMKALFETLKTKRTAQKQAPLFDEILNVPPAPQPWCHTPDRVLYPQRTQPKDWCGSPIPEKRRSRNTKWQDRI